MEFGIKAEKRFLKIPIKAECPEKKLEIFVDGKKVFEFMIPESQEKHPVYDFYSHINIGEYKGQELTFAGDFGETFYHDIEQSDERSYPKQVRPFLHFTADCGWINDPNGMVYADGMYHLFFQYNPMNTQWQNMTWGHCVSKDLLHFTQIEDGLYPDETGTMYSGCGIANEKGLLGLPKDALLFYYTAAGDQSDWSRGLSFTQRLAYSLDGGRTLVKFGDPVVDVIDKDSRDPKVFWHEESNSYVMALWIRGFEFGIFRSDDLKNWTQTDSFTLEDAWECPDLFCLELEGEKQWVFMSADGFYYFGTFDGWHFRTDGIKHCAYQTKLPYAAQSFSGLKDRVVCIPWMRTKNPAKLYTGMMGIPREMRLVRKNGEKMLSMVPVREYEETRTLEGTFAWGGQSFEKDFAEEKVVHVHLEPKGSGQTELFFFGKKLVFSEDEVNFGEETVKLDAPLTDINVVIDREFVEVYANDGTVNLYYETDTDCLLGKVEVKGNSGSGIIYTWQ